MRSVTLGVCVIHLPGEEGHPPNLTFRLFNFIPTRGGQANAARRAIFAGSAGQITLNLPLDTSIEIYQNGCNSIEMV